MSKVKTRKAKKVNLKKANVRVKKESKKAKPVPVIDSKILKAFKDNGIPARANSRAIAVAYTFKALLPKIKRGHKIEFKEIDSLYSKAGFAVSSLNAYFGRTTKRAINILGSFYKLKLSFGKSDYKNPSGKFGYFMLAK